MKLEKGESQQKKLFVGLFLGEVEMVNPTKEQLSKYLGYELKEDAKDIEYVGEDKDGNTRVNLSFWVKDKMSSNKFNVRFSITDKKMKSEKSGKSQYVNQLGMSSWADEKKNLQQWFTMGKDKDKNPTIDLQVRQAMQGEADLYDFMRCWISKVNWFSATADVLVDTKKLFRGNVDEIRNILTATGDDNLTGPVVLGATVYIKDGDDGKKMYQNVTTKAFLPGSKMSAVRLAVTNDSWDSDKALKRFKDTLLDPEYGVKDAFKLTLLEEFNENDHQQATDSVLKHSDSEMDY